MSHANRDSLTRRELLGGVTVAAGTAWLAAVPAGTATAGRKSTVVVAADGSSDFGPRTRGTRTSGIQEAIEAVSTRGGGVVHLRSGVYLVDSTPPPADLCQDRCGWTTHNPLCVVRSGRFAMRCWVVAMITLFAGLLVFCYPARAERLPFGKKLIEYGCDVPEAGYVRRHIREMETRPFDGIVLRLPSEFGRVFTVEKWDEAKYAVALDDLRGIEWCSFTDNFLIVWAASTMDWFSDDDWTTVLHNVGLMTQAAVAGKCKGICFDPEPYGGNPWLYSDAAHRGRKSFAEYQAQVRRRGAQFMRAITDKKPDAVVHTFFLLSALSTFPSDVISLPPSAEREARLAAEPYGLLPAFLNGMLDVVGPDVVITDGNESAYYYTRPLSYYESYHTIRQAALSLVAPENVREYHTQLQVGQALYVDQVFNLRAGGPSLAGGLSPEERASWFEQDVYYALTTADRYVWCYSERMNWWTGENIPPGLPEAIRSARGKLLRGEPLGFDMGAFLEETEKRMWAGWEAKLLRRTASIARRGPGTPAPVIDGQLDDAIWKATKPLETFVPYAIARHPVAEAGTRAKVAYDDNALYISFECEEPVPAQMRIVGDRRDYPRIWNGENVHVFLSVGTEPVPFVEFILNPDNVQWDARVSTQEDLTFGPDWQSAAAIGEGGWFVEMALPWREIGIPVPEAGETHRANLCRRRLPAGEHACWSQTVRRFTEPGSLGTWVFAPDVPASPR